MKTNIGWLILILLIVGCRQNDPVSTPVAIAPTSTIAPRATPTILSEATATVPVVVPPTTTSELVPDTPTALPPTDIPPSTLPPATPVVSPTAFVAGMPAFYTYEIINSYPHDPTAFTQGLIYEDNIFYEGTGLWQQSSVRKVVPETGDVLQQIDIDDQYFGEGITIFGDRIIQLTWQSRLGFVYDKNSFERLQTFNYPTEGWGITHDGEKLIMSDGTATIYFWDAETLAEIGHIEVRDGDQPVVRLNELEYINGEIWANVWQTNMIARIDPNTGQVVGWVDLTGLLAEEFRTQPVDVLNGIAYDAENDRLFVTGKLWPRLFEIKVVAEQ
jgi:glutamine cyclotransferase